MTSEAGSEPHLLPLYGPVALPYVFVLTVALARHLFGMHSPQSGPQPKPGGALSRLDIVFIV